MKPAARLLALVVALAALSPLGCITREVVDSIYNRKRVEVMLTEHKKGTQVIERGFTHPTRISQQRLSNILGKIEIRGRDEDLVGLRYVFELDQVPAVAEALSYGLGKADPNQTVAVRLVSKVMQHAIFNRKFITSFVSYVRDDLLFIHVSRVDWQLPDLKTKSDLPLPRIDEHPMKFKMVPSDGMFAEGNYAVSVDWKSDKFRRPITRVAGTGKGKRTILFEDDTPPEREAGGIPSDVLTKLSPDQLRELADLEEARQEGKLTEGHYRRLREKLIDEARKQ